MTIDQNRFFDRTGLSCEYTTVKERKVERQPLQKRRLRFALLNTTC